MSLIKYNDKRNFGKTTEPKGKSGASKQDLVFVVQKHAASHLHYDFRLEFNHVLKSWAVPKGPSLNPEEKRLAVMVEDHPYDYKDFEGNIPSGNYGAGNVIVWDNGTYQAVDASSPEDNRKRIKAGLAKGHLAIVLSGKKLKGEFDLVHIKGNEENAWLLIKKKDKYASSEDILLKKGSVISRASIESLQKKFKGVKAPIKKSASNNAGSKNVNASLVKLKEESSENELKSKKRNSILFVAPMLAETSETPFDDRRWIFEVKYDGYRTLALIENGKVQLRSRNEISFDTKFKSIAAHLSKLKHNVLLDGEVVVENKNGRSDFQLLQKFQKSGEGELKYYVFDLLNLDGIDTTNLTLLERKELLKLLLKEARLKNVFYSGHSIGKGVQFYNSAKNLKLEGVMAKNAESPYRIGKRSGEWLKIRISQQEEAIIVGITEPRGGRGFFGALVLAQMRNGKLIYVGNCGSGFSDSTLKELYSKFKTHFRTKSPLDSIIKLNTPIQWIAPKFVAQVKYSEITHDGFFRHPVFVGLRIDKSPKEVKIDAIQRNNEQQSNGMKKRVSSKQAIKKEKEPETFADDRVLKFGKVDLILTNQSKMYFPEDGFTKGDIVDYYNEVADIMLPYLRNRPESMNRFPSGIHGKSFYQKDVDVEKIPNWLKTFRVFSESAQKEIDYLLCNDKATLLYMANLGCIEINPWNSTTKHLDQPDWLVIDLDPERDEFHEVVRAAQAVRVILEGIEAECYCKTSGATGLHIYVPLGARYSYNTVKLFAEWIAGQVVKKLPDTTTVERSIHKRNKKIYIDFLQNRRGQTLAAPYSVRPKTGATVSTPLEWSEVNKKLSPSQFTIRNMLKRLDKKGDIWKPVIAKGVDLKKIIHLLEADGLMH